MLVLEAKVKIPYTEGTFGAKLYNGFRCTLLIDGIGYISETTAIIENELYYGNEFKAIIKVLYGECNIESFLSGSKFQYYITEAFGYGKVLRIKEIVFEKDLLDHCDETKLNTIFRIIDETPDIIIGEWWSGN